MCYRTLQGSLQSPLQAMLQGLLQSPLQGVCPTVYFCPGALQTAEIKCAKIKPGENSHSSKQN